MITKEEILNSEIGKELLLKFTKCTYASKGTDIDEFLEKKFEQFKKDQLKKDWEILSFKDKGGKFFTITDNKQYHDGKSLWRSLDSMLNSPFVSVKEKELFINSVKRSDGEVFCVGDNTYLGKITSFTISKDNSIIVHCDKLWEWLDHIKKVKQPLFFDHLGNSVYEGDTYWRVIIEDKTITFFTCSDDCIYNTTKGVFLNKSDAERYLMKKAMQLCLEDVEKYIWNEADVEKVKQLIKERLNLK